jgi:ribosomal protein S15
MAAPRSLTASFQSLHISRPCIRNISPVICRSSPFSTTSIALGGPVSRLRRERAHQKLRKAKARAEELRIQRAARADPVIGRSTSFTSSLLRPREILAQPGVAAHTRSGEEDWPLLTNFGINSEDALTLSRGAKEAGRRRLETRQSSFGRGGLWNNASDGFLYDNEEDKRMAERENLERDEAKKKEAMARLIDLTNSNSKAVMNANMEKAILLFGRHEGDTGSPEVQGSLGCGRMLMVAGVLTVRILALHEHMQHNRQDKRTKRALNMMVHQRQKMLKYLRKKSPERYANCLKEIGLDDSAIVKEVR